MRTPILLLAGMLTVASALAEDRLRLQPLPEIPPPPGVPDATLEPQVTITTRGEDRVEEYRIRGRLYAVKVTPPHGRSYYRWTSAVTGSWSVTTTSRPISWCPCG